MNFCVIITITDWSSKVNFHDIHHDGFSTYSSGSMSFAMQNHRRHFLANVFKSTKQNKAPISNEKGIRDLFFIQVNKYSSSP